MGRWREEKRGLGRVKMKRLMGACCVPWYTIGVMLLIVDDGGGRVPWNFTFFKTREASN